jgi:hypothetical protein
MRGHRAAVAVVCLAGLHACQRDYRFNTHARYESPGAHLEITIAASGRQRPIRKITSKPFRLHVHAAMRKVGPPHRQIAGQVVTCRSGSGSFDGGSR